MPIPSAEANLNPVSIRVTYEAESAGGEKFWVYGGDASWRLTSRLEVGGTYARDENPLQLTQLAGINATAKLAAGRTSACSAASPNPRVNSFLFILSSAPFGLTARRQAVFVIARSKVRLPLCRFVVRMAKHRL